ncbi:DUF1833 domain-containing protein [Stenotrophomonas sp. MA5]|uniref:DUF1833 family protein n=1 Tax=Stenotrophomonas sp. MA5 TaxID=2508572 RepID=UPI001009F20B|nr:DUF1833 family protein [Stenotrophomonas sp. MA5]RXK68611.1 DUF1833 domain-containing protein [Stenotrophomonas sp. MA5]
MTSFTERKQRITDTSGTLLFLSISAPSLPGPLRIVNDTRDWVSQGIPYMGVPFAFKLPDDTRGQSPRAQLVLDNVGRGISEDLEALGPNELMMARLMVSDRADPNVYERDYYLPITGVSVAGATATAQCGVDYLMRQQAVRLRANPFTLPGIF